MFDFLVTQATDSVAAPAIGAAPTTLVATADSDSIGLTWVDADTYTATVIMRKSDADYVALAVGAGNATSYDDTTAVPGTTYTYIVRGVKNGYPTPYSNTSSDTVPLAPPPTAPSNLVASGDFSEIQIDWTNNASYDSLVFERKLDSAPYESLDVTPEQVSYLDHPVDHGSYTYRIHGVVNGVSSNTVTSNTLVV